MKASDLATLLNGELIGGEYEFFGISSISSPKERTVIFSQDIRDIENLLAFDALFVVNSKVDNLQHAILISDVRYALAIFLQRFFPKTHPEGVSDKAHIEDSVCLGKGVYVGEFAYIGKNSVLEDGVKIYPHCYIGERVKIGAGSILYSGVRVYSDCEIGKNVIIHSGAVIGADGFGFHIHKDEIYKLEHIGKVIIEDFVEIGANTCIDRALIDETRIKRGSKIDNLVQIAHNCQIGENNLIAGQTGIAGSVKTGNWVLIGGGTAIKEHVEIDSHTKLAARSNVSKSLKTGVYGGNIPAMELSRWKRIYAYIQKLPEFIKERSD
ncbi:MAG: UDP-3-O-(3-hydroxymyristoyl)glucosamine N-acyltransferase [Aquificaceae bacterium]|nr:UDP-3-O-(3-hydroxymyristoyl)glucosamine N-acyltransferase [Aquificaceae bacterium]MDW8237359.1 UDP-3-O-(3-hydroxymyristoyl)glucosamine N-acyltransferase [Aquificaceae bacterium]